MGWGEGGSGSGSGIGNGSLSESESLRRRVEPMEKALEGDWKSRERGRD